MAVVELDIETRRKSMAPLHVYVDQNIWIGLASTESGRSAGDRMPGLATSRWRLIEERKRIRRLLEGLLDNFTETQKILTELAREVRPRRLEFATGRGLDGR